MMIVENIKTNLEICLMDLDNYVIVCNLYKFQYAFPIIFSPSPLTMFNPFKHLCFWVMNSHQNLKTNFIQNKEIEF